MNRIVPWILVLFPALVFVQSLPFKFTGAPETQFVFTTIGGWFDDSLGLAAIGDAFGAYGGYAVGAAEAIATILLLVPTTRLWGGLLGAALLAGAVFFHLVTPLGIAVQLPGTQSPDPSLFIMAVIGLACCIVTAWLNRPAAGQTAAAD